ncbi:probable flavin-containing monoamine oxidase A [Dreissena polymorpha]|nr:probable flavin-containing monoamine oxidase A [Dreissena polymorpha]
MNALEVDVIVIGAGISGLTAAHTLLKKDPGLDVLVLEAKERVGGRTLTVDLKSRDGTDKWDLGGQWVGRCQPHIMALLEELGIEVYPQHIDGRKYMQVGSKHRVSSYLSDIPSLPFLGLLDLNRLLKRTDEYSGEISPEDPFSCQHAMAWDCQTLENFVDSTIWSTDVKDLMRSCIRTMLGAELSQVSLLYFLSYVASAGNIRNLIEATENTAQEYKIKGGSQQICFKLMERIGKEKVRLGEPVASVQQSGNVVTVTTKTGHTYTCHKLILAIPPMQMSKVDIHPILPVDTREITKRMPPSNIIKFIITFSQAFWRTAGCSGEVVSNGGPTTCLGCEMGPVGIVYDATSCNQQPALLGFIGGLQAVQWQKQSLESRRSAVLKSLAEFFGDEVYAYLDFQEKIWDIEPFNEGAPVSIVGPGAMRHYAPGLRESFDRIHLAGTESATVWCGFMSGAVQAGCRAAIEVLYDLRPQLVTASDVQTLQAGRRRNLTKARQFSLRIVKWTVGFGVATVFLVAARKFFFSS